VSIHLKVHQAVAASSEALQETITKRVGPHMVAERAAAGSPIAASRSTKRSLLAVRHQLNVRRGTPAVEIPFPFAFARQITPPRWIPTLAFNVPIQSAARLLPQSPAPSPPPPPSPLFAIRAAETFSLRDHHRTTTQKPCASNDAVAGAAADVFQPSSSLSLRLSLLPCALIYLYKPRFLCRFVCTGIPGSRSRCFSTTIQLPVHLSTFLSRPHQYVCSTSNRTVLL
jgi:hypothetical protein